MLFEKIKKLWLRYVVGYRDPKEYWDNRWKFGLYAENKTEEAALKLKPKIEELMKKHDCNSILEVGCGRAVLHDLPNYTGLDFSNIVLKQSKAKNIVYADITKKIPQPTNSNDAVLSRYVSLHVPFPNINRTIEEICRVAKKLIMLEEPWDVEPKSTQPHCFIHNLPKLFQENFDGEVIFL